MKNLLIAQSGGPTAAINATIAGIMTTALASTEIDGIWGAENGIEGLLEERFINLREKLKNTNDLDLLCYTPSAALGSCRLKLKDCDQSQSQFQKIIEIFRKHHIHYFIYIGGNDSMDTVDKLSSYCKLKGISDITIVGAPKTIDNDLVGIDHCPGFGSAAKYIGVTFSELERDCNVYTTQTVTIVEVMGRNTGWLTAASALPRLNGMHGPHLIYLCEKAFNSEKFIDDVNTQLQHHNSILIAISEGLKNKKGQYISEEVQSNATDAFGHRYIAGAAKVLENLVREKFNCKVRSIELNLMQRCASHIASATDLSESKLLGIKACQCALSKQNGMMATLVRQSNTPYQVLLDTIPVNQVANREKIVPDAYIHPSCTDVSPAMLDYLAPLIQGEIHAHYESGLPKYISLY